MQKYKRNNEKPYDITRKIDKQERRIDKCKSDSGRRKATEEKEKLEEQWKSNIEGSEKLYEKNNEIRNKADEKYRRDCAVGEEIGKGKEKLQSYLDDDDDMEEYSNNELEVIEDAFDIGFKNIDKFDYDPNHTEIDEDAKAIFINFLQEQVRKSLVEEEQGIKIRTEKLSEYRTNPGAIICNEKTIDELNSRIIFLVDSSGSMEQDSWRSSINKEKIAKDVMSTLGKVLDDVKDPLGIDYSIIAFGSRNNVRVIKEFGSEEIGWERWNCNDRETAIKPAFLKAIEMFEEEEGGQQMKKIIITLSDGGWNGGFRHGYNDNFYLKNEDSGADYVYVRKMFPKNNISLINIGITLDDYYTSNYSDIYTDNVTSLDDLGKVLTSQVMLAMEKVS
ncbi:unnamed protein product, partial [marine sediment metagenome]